MAGPFGFDPSLILSQNQPERLDIAGSLQSGMALGDLIHKRQRESALTNIYRQSGGDPASLSSLLLKSGFGPEAFAAQDQAAQMEQQRAMAAAHNATAQKAKADVLTSQLAAFGQAYRNVKDTAGARMAKQSLLQAGFPPEHVAMLPDEYNDQTAPQLEQFKSFAMSAKDAAQLEHQKADLEERTKYHEGMLKRPSGMPALTLVQTADGYQLVNTRDPKAPAAPALGQDGQPIKPPEKPKSSRPLTKSDRDSLDSFRGQAQTAGELLSNFDDSYAGKGIAGSTGVQLNQKLGSMASEEGQKEAAFWANYAKLVDLPDRNKTFGSSLTDTEKSSWEDAKTIKPGSSPKLVREQLAKMQKIASDAMARRARSLVKDGYNQEAIEEFTGPLSEAAAGPASGAPGGRAKVTVSDGKETLVIDAADLADAQKDGFKPVKR